MDDNKLEVKIGNAAAVSDDAQPTAHAPGTTFQPSTAEEAETEVDQPSADELPGPALAEPPAGIEKVSDITAKPAPAASFDAPQAKPVVPTAYGQAEPMSGLEEEPEPTDE